MVSELRLHRTVNGVEVSAEDNFVELAHHLSRPEFTEITPVRPAGKIPGVREGSWQKGDRHIGEWLLACKRGTPPSANFAVSGPLTEMVLLGNVALRSGKPIEWDSEKLEVTKPADANRFIRREYRVGW